MRKKERRVPWRETPPAVRSILYFALLFHVSALAVLVAILLRTVPVEQLRWTRIAAVLASALFGVLAAAMVWRENKFARPLALAGLIVGVAIFARPGWPIGWLILIIVVVCEWGALYLNDSVYDYYLRLEDAQRSSE